MLLFLLGAWIYAELRLGRVARIALGIVAITIPLVGYHFLIEVRVHYSEKQYAKAIESLAAIETGEKREEYFKMQRAYEEASRTGGGAGTLYFHARELEEKYRQK